MKTSSGDAQKHYMTFSTLKAEGVANGKIDVAINIFAKPFRTSLAILSLLKACGGRIGTLWLQFEPMGIGVDQVPPYLIYDYLKEECLANCRVSQPKIWLAREAVTAADFANPERRLAIRYQTAFERSKARLLFLLHNDVFIYKDILGPMSESLGDAFAIGQLGQCWNCPASHEGLMREVLGRGACKPAFYSAFRPDHQGLCALYEAAQAQKIFVRPYELGQGEFASRPWPLPECRVNEWACLINLEKSRGLCQPNGPAYPPGAYRACGEYNLDIGVPYFRDLHKSGLAAKNFELAPYLEHFVGTGKNTPLRYAKAEGKALQLLRRHFGAYVEWVKKKLNRSEL